MLANMCAKPGKILSPKTTAAIHSPSTLSATSRKQSRWTMRGAIRRSVDDMIEILESGDRKATTFLIGEIERPFNGQSLGWWEGNPGGRPAAKPASSEPFILISGIVV